MGCFGRKFGYTSDFMFTSLVSLLDGAHGKLMERLDNGENGPGNGHGRRSKSAAGGFIVR